MEINGINQRTDNSIIEDKVFFVRSINDSFVYKESFAVKAKTRKDTNTSKNKQSATWERKRERHKDCSVIFVSNEEYSSQKKRQLEVNQSEEMETDQDMPIHYPIEEGMQWLVLKKGIKALSAGTNEP